MHLLARYHKSVMDSTVSISVKFYINLLENVLIVLDFHEIYVYNRGWMHNQSIFLDYCC
jgi:hypothetical protein